MSSSKDALMKELSPEELGKVSGGLFDWGVFMEYVSAGASDEKQQNNVEQNFVSCNIGFAHWR